MNEPMRLRLQWFWDTYIVDSLSNGRIVLLLDIGRYDAAPAREALLTGECVRYFRLADNPEQTPEYVTQLPDSMELHRDSSFDIVVSTHALEHSPRPWMVMDEAFRVLRPGGIACFIEPGLRERRVQGAEYIITSYRKHSFLPDYYRFGAQSLASMAVDVGFHVLHASMNQGPQETPKWWHVASECILVVRKPLKSAEEIPSASGQADDALPLSWLECRSKNDPFIGRKTLLRQMRADPYYARESKQKTTMLFCGNCSVIEMGVFMRVAYPNLEVRYEFFPMSKYAEALQLNMKPSFVNIADQTTDVDILWVSSDVEPKWYANCGCMVIRVPSVFFCGYHPDFTGNMLLPARGKASNIVCECIARGYSESKALSYFNRAVYSRLGYFSAWQIEEKRLVKEFADLNMDLYDFLPHWVRTGVFMCDHLHPMDFVLIDIVKYFCGKHGLKLSESATSTRFAVLHKDRQPVYPEIAEFLGQPEVGSYMFRRTYPIDTPFQWEDAIQLDEYIHLAYAHFLANPDLLQSLIRMERL